MYQELAAMAQTENSEREALHIQAIQRSLLKLSARLRLNAVVEQGVSFRDGGGTFKVYPARKLGSQ